jgi:hypothetical protein
MITSEGHKIFSIDNNMQMVQDDESMQHLVEENEAPAIS